MIADRAAKQVLQLVVEEVSGRAHLPRAKSGAVGGEEPTGDRFDARRPRVHSKMFEDRAEQIPLEVRIVSVADRFEALLADRADRPAVSEQEAIRILQSAVARGELDAAVVAALATQVRSSGAR